MAFEQLMADAAVKKEKVNKEKEDKHKAKTETSIPATHEKKHPS